MSELQERVRRLIEILEHMRKRPGMYFLPQDSNTLQNYMNGVHLGSGVSGIELGHSDKDKIDLEILQEHGLRVSAASLTRQLEEQGHPVEKIIDETILIYIETLKRRYNSPDQEQKQE